MNNTTRCVFVLLLLSCFVRTSYAIEPGLIKVEEADGSPSAWVKKLILPNGSLSTSGSEGTYVEVTAGDLTSHEADTSTHGVGEVADASVMATDTELSNHANLVSNFHGLFNSKFVGFFTSLTGGGTGALDSYAYASLSDGEWAIVMNSGAISFYQWQAAGTAAEDAPDIILADDDAGDGQWNNATSIVLGSSTSPGYALYDDNDEEAAATRPPVAQFRGDLTTTTANAQVGDWFLDSVIAGAITPSLQFDASDAFHEFKYGIDLENHIIKNFALGAIVPITQDTVLTSCWGERYVITGAFKATLPAMSTGMNCEFNYEDAGASTDTNAADKLRLKTGALTDDGDKGIPAADGDSCSFQYYDADSWKVIGPCTDGGA